MNLLRNIWKLASRPSSLIGLVIVFAFYGWSLVEGALQLLGDLLQRPNLGWVLLPYNPYAYTLSNSLLPPSIIH